MPRTFLVVVILLRTILALPPTKTLTTARGSASAASPCGNGDCQRTRRMKPHWILGILQEAGVVSPSNMMQNVTGLEHKKEASHVASTVVTSTAQTQGEARPERESPLQLIPKYDIDRDPAADLQRQTERQVEEARAFNLRPIN